MPTETLQSRIETIPGVLGGKPRIVGRRITVRDMAIRHERLGRSVDEIATEYAPPSSRWLQTVGRTFPADTMAWRIPSTCSPLLHSPSSAPAEGEIVPLFRVLRVFRG